MSDIVTLRKYTVNERKVVAPSPLEGILLDLWNNIMKQGVFLTLNQFATEKDAQEYNAITYTPEWENEYQVDHSVFRSIQHFTINYITKEVSIPPNKLVFVNPYGRREPTRTWPAFGHYGGGFETILISGCLNSTLTRDKFPPSTFDEYTYDSTLPGKFSRLLGEIFSQWLSIKKGIMEQPPENPASKILEQHGVIISWLFDNLNWTISCGYKMEQKHLKLKFWGYIWEDQENTIRNLSKPVIKHHKFCNQTISQIRQAFNSGDRAISQPIHQILNKIYQKMASIASDFKKNINKRVDLTNVPMPHI